MSADLPKARELDLLDAIDSFERTAFSGRVWRVVREGRDPTIGGPSRSRWCDGNFDVLYTSMEQDGAIAEIEAFLSLQPVFPSKMRWFCHALNVRAASTLRIADLATLRALGVDTAAYAERRYERTQAIADAALFLGFDGLIAPNARWSCLNLMLFTSRLPPDCVEASGEPGVPVEFAVWRRSTRK
ncbi:MAG: RES family NAD+ phosphorylase [Beijerinckiaceae bacterium]